MISSIPAIKFITLYWNSYIEITVNNTACRELFAPAGTQRDAPATGWMVAEGRRRISVDVIKPRWMTNWMLNRISWPYLINWKSCFDDKLWKLRTNEQRMCISDDFWQFYLNYGRPVSSWPFSSPPLSMHTSTVAGDDDSDSNCTLHFSSFVLSMTTAVGQLVTGHWQMQINPLNKPSASPFNLYLISGSRTRNASSE